MLGVGIESLHLTQEIPGLDPADAKYNYGNMDPAGEMHGIVFKWAANSWVRGIRTKMTGSHPIVTEEAKNLQIVDNHLDGAWNKGKGGNGYFRGSRVWDSLYAGNVSRNLRHFTFQWSASGNVVIGNDFDSDLNLHGGWERNNLFELNTVRVPYAHRSANCSANCGEEDGGGPDNSTWFPIWWGCRQESGQVVRCDRPAQRLLQQRDEQAALLGHRPLHRLLPGPYPDLPVRLERQGLPPPRHRWHADRRLGTERAARLHRRTRHGRHPHRLQAVTLPDPGQWHRPVPDQVAHHRSPCRRSDRPVRQDLELERRLPRRLRHHQQRQHQDHQLGPRVRPAQRHHHHQVVERHAHLERAAPPLHQPQLQRRHRPGASEKLGFNASGTGLPLDNSHHVTIDGMHVHHIDEEAVHFRRSSADGIIRDSVITDTGLVQQGYGEAVYIGSAKSNFGCHGNSGGMDRSDRVQVLDNQIGPNVTAEHVDVKEGTADGVIRGNRFDGQGISGANSADSWVDVKGSGYLIEDNTGTFRTPGTFANGYETHNLLDGYGCGNTWRDNTSDLGGVGRYAIRITSTSKCSSNPNVVHSSNTVTGAVDGLTNIPTTP